MNMVGDGHSRRRAAKRADILAAAQEVFLREGYGRANMDQVLARIGGSKRTLYSHFRSKDELFVAMVKAVSDRVLAALRPDLSATDFRETLIRMGMGYLSVLLSGDGRALYRAVISEAPHFPELARRFFENGPGRASRYLADFLMEQKDRGVLDTDDPALAAEQFIGMVRGDVHLAAVLGTGMPTDRQVREIVEQAVETFLCGVAPDLCDKR